MTVITTGVRSPSGSPVARQDLRAFLQDQDLTNLYLLALQRLQTTEQRELLSWFQIAGIHGRPYIPFDGVGSAGNFGGYCTHSSILFPTWHRPYLALYEQTLANLVNQIANEFTDPAQKEKYVNAASRFRVPYWDWASESVLPDIVSTQETVTVTTPSSGSQEIKNPLYSYTFHPVYSTFGDGLPDEKTWEAWQSTLRYPTATNAQAESQPEALERQLQNNRLTLRDRTYNLLTQATTYSAFSNDGFMGPASDPRFYDSLESVHGQIHGLIGRNGHMGVVDYAAFDPVFWLHHANVDRLFAIWQALNPNEFVTARPNEAGTFTTKAGTVEDARSPLQPFYQSEGVFWTSDTARDTRTFGYTYPELERWADLSEEEKRVRLHTEVNRLYGRSAPVATVRPQAFAAAPAAAKPPARAPAPAPPPPTAAAKPPAAQTTKPAAAAPAAAKLSSSVPAPKPAASTPSVPQPPAVQAAKPAVEAPKPAAKPAGSVASEAKPASSVVPKAKPAGSSAPEAAKAKLPISPGVIAGQVASAVKSAVHAVKEDVEQHAQRPLHVHKHGEHHGQHREHAEPARSPAGKGRQEPREEGVEITGTSNINEPDWHETATTADDKAHYHEWIANIRVEKYAVKSTFFVHIFLGDFTQNPAKWGEDPNLVGSHVIFANNASFTGCQRCVHSNETRKLVTGTIPLTGALGDKLGLDKLGHLEPDIVVPYLRQHLHWRIQKHDNTPIERKDIPSLKISVGHALVEVPQTAAEFPSWGKIELSLGVTTGRLGGANEAD